MLRSQVERIVELVDRAALFLVRSKWVGVGCCVYLCAKVYLMDVPRYSTRSMICATAGCLSLGLLYIRAHYYAIANEEASGLPWQGDLTVNLPGGTPVVATVRVSVAKDAA